MASHLAAVLNTSPRVALRATGPSETETTDSLFLAMALMVGDSAWAAKDWDQATTAYDLALRLKENVEALNRRGRLELIGKRPAEACAFFARAMEAKPEPATAVNMANALARLGEFNTADSWCAVAERLDPAFIPAFIQQAAILEEQGQYVQAEAEIVRGLEIDPGNTGLLWFLSTYQLRRGDFAKGWVNHEQRPPRREIAAKMDEYREWQGEPLDGKKLLVIGEQGAGDQIMWSRYLPLLTSAGADVALFTRPELARLFAASFPGVRIVTSNDQMVGLEPDYWVAMASLALRCGGNEPGTAHRSPPTTASSWRLRVGLCWRGSAQHPRDAGRSMTWEQMRPLLDVRGVEFFSLQFGEAESGLPNLTEHDFQDTAEAMVDLDLVITVDTAIAHLAGSCGVPVWIMLNGFSDWRWGVSAETSYWYPSARLLRSVSVESIAIKLSCAAFDESCKPRPVAIYRDGACTALPMIQQPNPIATRDCRYGPMSFLANDHYIGRALALYGEYSQSEADLLRKVLKPGDVVIEAGANVGGLTVALADIVGQDGLVVAYEPQPAYFELLRKNKERNVLGRFALGRFALGAHDGTITMRTVETVNVHAPGWESCGEEFSVRQVTIDGSFPKAPAFALIKIDVDGPELDILKGAEGTINRCRPLLYVEYDKPEQYPDMIPWIHAHGYRIYKHEAPLFNPDNFAGNPVNVFGPIVSLMLLCVPMERKDLRPTDWGLTRVTVS